MLAHLLQKQDSVKIHQDIYYFLAILSDQLVSQQSQPSGTL